MVSSVNFSYSDLYSCINSVNIQLSEVSYKALTKKLSTYLSLMQKDKLTSPQTAFFEYTLMKVVDISRKFATTNSNCRNLFIDASRIRRNFSKCIVLERELKGARNVLGNFLNISCLFNGHEETDCTTPLTVMDDAGFATFYMQEVRAGAPYSSIAHLLRTDWLSLQPNHVRISIITDCFLKFPEISDEDPLPLLRALEKCSNEEFKEIIKNLKKHQKLEHIIYSAFTLMDDNCELDEDAGNLGINTIIRCKNQRYDFDVLKLIRDLQDVKKISAVPRLMPLLAITDILDDNFRDLIIAHSQQHLLRQLFSQSDTMPVQPEFCWVLFNDGKKIRCNKHAVDALLKDSILLKELKEIKQKENPDDNEKAKPKLEDIEIVEDFATLTPDLDGIMTSTTFEILLDFYSGKRSALFEFNLKENKDALSHAIGYLGLQSLTCDKFGQIVPTMTSLPNFAQLYDFEADMPSPHKADVTLNGHSHEIKVHSVVLLAFSKLCRDCQHLLLFTLPNLGDITHHTQQMLNAFIRFLYTLDTSSISDEIQKEAFLDLARIFKLDPDIESLLKAVCPGPLRSVKVDFPSLEE